MRCLFRGLLLPALLCVLLLALVPGWVLAEVDLQKLQADFKPVSGYLVMPMGDEFLVDLDAASGLRSGDLLSVIVPGQKVLHPVTREVIGTLDEVKAILQVTRVKSGYSYARPLTGAAADLKAAEVVRRFEQVPALFWDYTGDGEPFYNQLAAALPHLDWMSYTEAQGSRPDSPQPLTDTKAALVFIYDRQGLDVKAADMASLGSYGMVATAAGIAPSVQLPTSGISPQARPSGHP